MYKIHAYFLKFLAHLTFYNKNRYGCHALASKGWCTLKYGRDDPWPVLEDWFLRFQMATLLDNDEETEQDLGLDFVFYIFSQFSQIFFHERN